MSTSELADHEALLAHSEWLHALALRLVRDPDVAEDLAQDTYVAALGQNAAAVRSPRAWLGGILRNQLWMRLRGEGRRQKREAAAASAEAEPSTFDVVARAAGHREVVDAVMSMSEPYREVLLLRYFEGEMPTTIARRRDVPVATVKTQLQRGLAQLRTRLDDGRGGDRRAWMAALVPILRAPPRAAASGAFALHWIAAALVVLAAGSAAFIWWPESGHTGPSVEELRVAGSAVPEASEGASEDEAGPERARIRTGGGRVELDDYERSAFDPSTRRVQGRVVDAQGAPLPGLVVRFVPEYSRAPNRGGGLRIAVSDPAGEFALDDVAARGFVEVASATHTSLVAGYPEFDRGGWHVTVVAVRSVSLAGTVVDASGTPLAEALVEVVPPAGVREQSDVALEHSVTRRHACVTASDGRFALSRAPAVEGAQLVVKREGFVDATAPMPRDGKDGWTVTLQRLEPRPGDLRGFVFDVEGRAVADAKVSDGTFVTRSARDGSFCLPGSEEPRTVRALAAGRQPGEVRVGTSDELLEVRLGPAPLRLRGVVLSPAGDPVPFARVWIADPTVFWCSIRDDETAGVERRGARYRDIDASWMPQVVESLLSSDPLEVSRVFETADDGGFDIDGLCDRNYTVSVMTPAGAIQSIPNVRPGEEAVILRVDPTAERSPIRGRVVGADGTPVEGVDVGVQRVSFALRREESTIWSNLKLGPWRRTAADGTFELRGVPPGEIALRVEGVDVLTHARDVTDDGFQTVRVTRRLPMRVSIPTDAQVVSVELRDAAGELVLAQRFEGNTRRTLRGLPVVGGTTGWFTAPETAVEVVATRPDGAPLRASIGAASGGRVEVHVR